MEDAGVDQSLFAQTRFLKQELNNIIEATAEDQEKKFEARFGKLERKLQTMAKLTDGALKNIEKNIAGEKEDVKKWQDREGGQSLLRRRAARGRRFIAATVLVEFLRFADFCPNS